MAIWLPNQDWTVASKSTLTTAAAGTAAASRQVSLSAEGARLPIIYGRDRRGALIANIVTQGAYIYVQCIWGIGPIDGVESFAMSDAALPTGYSLHHYTGTSGQAVDSWLASAFASNGIAYSDALPGVAYSVLRAPVGDEAFNPSGITAIVRGLTLYDPRTGLTAWSDNPALALADFIASAAYGDARAVDWASVAAAANACDELVGGEKRRRIGLTLAQAQTCDTWRETLRTYAGCFVVQGANGWRLIPDRPASVAMSIADTAGQIARLGTMKKRARADAPTVMSIRWTDTSTTPWSDRVTTAYASGVAEGTTPRRESEVSLPGIQSAPQAYREAVERMNKLTLADLSFDLDLFDEGGQLEPGDVIAVTHERGITAKQMRVTSVSSASAGRYTLSLTEYDPAVYSDAVVSAPSTPDTSLPSLAAPLAITGLTLAEELVTLQDGTTSSRIRASWVAPEYPWIASYRIAVRVGAAVVYTGTASRSDTSWPSPPVQELVSHQVDIYTVSAAGAESDPASATIIPEGKYLPPSDVPVLSGYEVGGEVRLRWSPATDIDIWRYEIRYGATGATWDAATLLDRVDALSLTTKDVPAGTFDFLVKALDSVGNYSANPARRTITVTLDNAAFLVDQHAFSSPTLTGMAEYNLGPTDSVRRFATEDGVTCSAKFTAALSSYTLPVGGYSSGSTFQTEAYDFGLSLSGNWTGELSVANVAGSASSYLDLSPDGSAWSPYLGLLAKTGARLARLRATTSGAMVVTIPTATVRIDAVPRTEEGTGTSSASGPTTVTLAGAYAALKGLPQITVGGSTFATAVVDNIIVGTTTKFDVYVFDASESLISRPFGWSSKGV